jgi:hypothetical protein
MEAVAHNATFAKKVGIPQSVGRDFSAADKGKKFSKGGVDSQPQRQSINQPKTNHGGQAFFKQGGNMATKKMSSKMMAFEKSGKDIEKKGMKEGSKADMAMDKKQMMGIKKGGMAMKKMAMGGSASSRADGIASRGKTKGKMLAKGGMAKKYC